MKKLVLFLIFLFLSGCMMNLSSIHLASMAPAEQVYSPAIGVQHEALLGDIMIDKIDGIPAEGFVAIEQFQPSPIVHSYGTFLYSPVLRGSEWAIIGTLENGDYLCKNNNYPEPIFNGTQTKGNTALLVNKNGEPYGTASYQNDKAYLSPWATKPNNFLKRVGKVYLTGSFKQELLYNGKSQNIIKLSYREFKEDWARPAFSQELTYDLSEGKTIGFRGMKIEVLETTNSDIKFIIRSPMN